MVPRKTLHVSPLNKTRERNYRNYNASFDDSSNVIEHTADTQTLQTFLSIPSSAITGEI